LGIDSADFSFFIVPKAVNVNRSEASALSPPLFSGEALIAATGLSFSSPVETIQSRAFFRTPGTPKAYSGVQIMTASDFYTFSRKTLTTILSSSKPGLKCGNFSRPSNISKYTSSPAIEPMFFKILVFAELLLKLPEMARIFILFMPVVFYLIEFNEDIKLCIS
jgi:hypothetical protein